MPKIKNGVLAAAECCPANPAIPLLALALVVFRFGPSYHYWLWLRNLFLALALHGYKFQGQPHGFSNAKIQIKESYRIVAIACSTLWNLFLGPLRRL